MAAAGLAGGYFAGQVAGTQTGRAVDETEQQVRPGAKGPAASTGGTRRTDQGTAARSTIRSEDTLEDLLALPNEDGLFARMALWLMDASPDEIATYWEKRKEKENQDRDIKDLVMIGWTRVDPLGATAALAGTGDEHYAWWAWACHDPEAALQAAIDNNPGCLGNVAWGIGEFHPQWLRENWDRIPESGRSRALQGLLKWGEVDDAMATLEFLKEQNRTPPKDLMRNMVRQDPWAAYEWFEKNGSSLSSYYGGSDHAMNMLIIEMADSHPEVLQQLIAQQPSGARKREMEAAAFRNLVTLDLDAALEEARTTTAPRIQADRLATVGMQVARTDPGRAFEIARELFTGDPQAFNQVTVIVYPNGNLSTGSGGHSPANQLLNMLVAQDPVRAMSLFDSAPPQDGDDQPSPTVIASVPGDPFGAYRPLPHSSDARQRVASQWAQQDLEGFATWVVGQDDSATTSQYAPAILNNLQSQYRFDEAVDWALSIDQEASRTSHLRNVVRHWHRLDPEQARNWVESAELTEQERQHVDRIVQEEP